MKNTNNMTAAQPEITARTVVNGATVIMKFSSEQDNGVLNQVKQILSSAYTDEAVQGGHPHLDNRI